MSYIMTQWQNGQEPPINAENLNKIERGIYDAHQTAEGKYSKPSLGIPKNDLAESVKNSLDNADSALQDDDVDSALSLISTNPVQNKIITNKIAGTDRRLDMLYKLTQGQAWDFDKDNNNAYSVDVPSGARYASVDMVGGKSVAWNQLWNYEKTQKEAGITYTYENHFYDVVKDTTAHNGIMIRYNVKSNNKYYVSFEASSNDNIRLSLSLGISLVVELTESNKRYSKIITTDGSASSRSYVYVYSPSGVTCSYRVGNIKIIDLTQMFGAGNEPSTVEEFEAMFPDDYYPYSEPTIISSQTDRVDVRGKNLFNENAEIREINVIYSAGEIFKYKAIYVGKGLGEVYASSLKNPNKRSVFYYVMCLKPDGTFRKGTEYFITPDGGNNGLITVGKDEELYIYDAIQTESLEYISEMNVQIEKGSTATEYVPYREPQQVTTNFPVLNSAGSVYDYIDLNKGKFHQRIGVVDLGTLNWTSQSNDTQKSYYVKLSSAKPLSYDNAILIGYTSHGVTNFVSSGDKIFTISAAQNVNINDNAYATVEEFKQGMSGVMLYYELAEEIVTDIEIPTELSDWLTVEAGGSITFHNVDEGKRLLIPSTEEYLVKLSEVISNG